MKVKNKRAFAAGIITVILGIVCFVDYINRLEQRFLIAGLLLVILSAINFIKGFSSKNILEEMAENTDERDLYIAMKSSQIAVKTINYTIFAFMLIFMILYGIWKYQYFIVISGTLCAVLAVMFVVFLTVNIYLEKHQ